MLFFYKPNGDHSMLTMGSRSRFQTCETHLYALPPSLPNRRPTFFSITAR